MRHLHICIKSIPVIGIIILSIIYRSQCQKIGENTTLICNHDECLIDPSLLNTIRTQSRQFGWSAKNYSEFWGVIHMTTDSSYGWYTGITGKGVLNIDMHQ